MLACTEMITMCLQSAKRKHLLAQQQPLQITGQGLPIFHDIFRRADKNDDGKLTFEEFNTYFADSILTTEELQELFCSIDGRQNDNLDTEKLSDYFAQHLGGYVNVLSALESLNIAILKAMDKTKEEYQGASVLGQFVTRFMLRETSSQLLSLQRSLQYAMEAVEEQSCPQPLAPPPLPNPRLQLGILRLSEHYRTNTNIRVITFYYKLFLSLDGPFTAFSVYRVARLQLPRNRRADGGPVSQHVFKDVPALLSQPSGCVPPWFSCLGEEGLWERFCRVAFEPQAGISMNTSKHYTPSELQSAAPATCCGARQLSKLKRFLTTLQQFGNDIRPRDRGKSVRNLVLALVENSTVTIEEFTLRLTGGHQLPTAPLCHPSSSKLGPQAKPQTREKSESKQNERGLGRCPQRSLRRWYGSHKTGQCHAPGLKPRHGVVPETLKESFPPTLIPPSSGSQAPSSPDLDSVSKAVGCALNDPSHPFHYDTSHYHQISNHLKSPGGPRREPTCPCAEGAAHCARAAKQNPGPSYLSQHEHLLLSTTLASAARPTLSCCSWRPGDSARDTATRTVRNVSTSAPPTSLEPAAKRICTISPAPRHSPAHPTPHAPLPWAAPAHAAAAAPARASSTPPPRRCSHYALRHRHPPTALHRETQPAHAGAERAQGPAPPAGTNGAYREEPVDHRLTDREWADEWRHLDHVLNCIVDMVEKTRRSVSVLRRCQESDREELNYWRRRSSEQDDPRKGGPGSAPFSKTHSPHSADSDSQRDMGSRPGSAYVPDEIWRKAEEAVNEVKRQAMDEVQKAGGGGGAQGLREMIASERAKMEKTLADAKRRPSRTPSPSSTSRRTPASAAGTAAARQRDGQRLQRCAHLHCAPSDTHKRKMRHPTSCCSPGSRRSQAAHTCGWAFGPSHGVGPPRQPLPVAGIKTGDRTPESRRGEGSVLHRPRAPTTPSTAAPPPAGRRQRDTSRKGWGAEQGQHNTLTFGFLIPA
ncbi:unnamed protein product [Arctogadus glacialis]